MLEYFLEVLDRRLVDESVAAHAIGAHGAVQIAAVSDVNECVRRRLMRSALSTVDGALVVVKTGVEVALADVAGRSTLLAGTNCLHLLQVDLLLSSPIFASSDGCSWGQETG